MISIRLKQTIQNLFRLNLTEPDVVALERILFVLPKIGSTLEFLLMRPLRAKFGKICRRIKKVEDADNLVSGRRDR